MKRLLFIALLMATTISAQTKVSVSSGVLEQSNKFGLGIASTISVDQNIIGTAGLGVDYTYAVLRGKDFQQVSLTAYKEYTVGRTLGIKPNAGVARQISGDIYPTFGLDLLARASDKVQIVLGWQPTVRGHFRDADTGWSLITTIGVTYKL